MRWLTTIEKLWLEATGKVMCEERKRSWNTLMKSEKERDPWKYIYIFGRCIDMYARCWCKLEDVMMKDHHKGNVDFNVHSFTFKQITVWAYAGLPQEDLCISSTTNAHVVGWKILKETWHEEGNIAWRKARYGLMYHFPMMTWLAHGWKWWMVCALRRSPEIWRLSNDDKKFIRLRGGVIQAVGCPIISTYRVVVGP